MALTRPTIQNINSNLTTFTDSLTVTNFGNVANRDIGEVFDRSQGSGSNVALIWQESTQSFRAAYTSSTGKETGNITITGNADFIVGNLTAGNLLVANVIYQNTEYVSSTEVVAGNSTVNGLTVNNSATVGSTLSVVDQLTTANIVPSANAVYTLGSPTARYKSLYLSGNTIYMDGTTISSNSTAIVFTNPAGGSFTVSGTTPLIASSTAELSSYVTGNTQGNINTLGTLTGLTLSGAVTGTAVYASTFGNNGANFTGNLYSAISLVTENITASNVTQFNGPVTISNIGNLTIPGGFSGYVMKTDGAGHVSWQGAGGITYSANTAPPIAGNLTGDQWYNTSSDVLYEYSFDGTNYYWVDQSGAAFGNTNGASGIANGSSNVAINSFNGNITFSANARSNLVVISSSTSGATLQVTGANTRGGAGYVDFLQATNNSGGATNPNKWFRLNSTGGLEIIDSAYAQNLFNLSDVGALSIPGPFSISGKQAVNGPAFSAYANATLQTITSGSQQKVLFQTEEFDTNSNFASSRFTPTVEGYYQLNAEVRLDGASGTGEMMIILYKNGSEYKRGTNQSGTQIASNFWAMQVSSVVYANGTGDYFEIYVQQGSGGSVSVTAVNNPAITWFNGCMLRGA